MNLLFDEGVAWRYQKEFARSHQEFTVSNVSAMGWGVGSDTLQGLSKEGMDQLLIRLAFQSGFHILVTTDKAFMEYGLAPLSLVVLDIEWETPDPRFLRRFTVPLRNEILRIETQVDESQQVDESRKGKKSRSDPTHRTFRPLLLRAKRDQDAFRDTNGGFIDPFASDRNPAVSL